MIKIKNKKRFAVFVLICIALICGIVFGTYKAYKYFTRTKTLSEMSFEEAGRIGEKKTYQVLVRINKISSDSKSEPERGDVLMTASEDKQWSVAEQEGFLIIKVNLTPNQAALLVQPKEVSDVKNEKDPKSKKAPAKVVDSSRKFAIDLSKVGISPEEERGKVISDKIFEGKDVVIKKPLSK